MAQGRWSKLPKQLQRGEVTEECRNTPETRGPPAQLEADTGCQGGDESLPTTWKIFQGGIT